MLSLKLSRTGKKKQPTFRLIVTEKARDPWGKYKEVIGTINLRGKEKRYSINAERVKYWLSVGAQPTETVKNMLINQGLLKGEKAKAVRISKKRKAKLEAKKPKGEAPTA
ncbi:MAG: 30S ribosomal protein S16 [Patescibacteria group bacterium]